MGASVSHLAPHWTAPRPSPRGQQALCVRPLENGHDRGRQEELLLAGDSGDGGQVLPDPGGHREGGRGSGLFRGPRGLLGPARPGRDRRRCSVALSALPSGPPPAAGAPLPSSEPSHPCPRPEPWAPASPVSSSNLPIVPAPPASCPLGPQFGPWPVTPSCSLAPSSLNWAVMASALSPLS